MLHEDVPQTCQWKTFERRCWQALTHREFVPNIVAGLGIMDRIWPPQLSIQPLRPTLQRMELYENVKTGALPCGHEEPVVPRKIIRKLALDVVEWCGLCLKCVKDGLEKMKEEADGDESDKNDEEGQDEEDENNDEDECDHPEVREGLESAAI
jgi:hypothetical protein